MLQYVRGTENKQCAPLNDILEGGVLVEYKVKQSVKH